MIRKIVGVHSCRTALEVRSPRELLKIYFKPEWRQSPALKELETLAVKKGLIPEPVSVKKLNLLSPHHQGVAVHVRGRPQWEPSKLPKDATVLVLEGVEDPKNLGAVIRTSWLMGVKGIFIPRRGAVDLTPAVMKSASGGAEYVPVCPVSISHHLKTLRQTGFWICGLDAKANRPLWGEAFEGRTAFVLGGEHSGLKALTRKLCDRLISIPQREARASYNVSVSAGMVLFERLRQKQAGPL